jgi:hypothetical protein
MKGESKSKEEEIDGGNERYIAFVPDILWNVFAMDVGVVTFSHHN